jgi:hypothetical protein
VFPAELFGVQISCHNPMMSVFNIFSKRQKALRGEVSDVYIYDKIPSALRVQIIHILRDALGTHDHYEGYGHGTARAYKLIVEVLCREYGLFVLPGTDISYGGRNYLSELSNFLQGETDSEKVLDAIELSFRVIDRRTRDWNFLNRNNATEIADAAIEELNTRFREHTVGYQYDGGDIIRVDSEVLHVEIVKPALSLLRGPEYAGAQAEFLAAHEHYRHGRSKEALAECMKALESVMKIICAKRKWKHDPNATAKPLLDVLFSNGLVPAFWAQHFSGLRGALESGVPAARNKLGGHGQGTQVVHVPEHLVAFVLHSTASAIVFLVEAEKALP